MSAQANGKIILITGVGRRIGAHLAAHLMNQGHRVIGTYRKHTPQLATLIDQGLIAVPCELTEPAAAQKLGAAVIAAVSRLDAIIHNASVWYDDTECALDPTKSAELYHVHVTAPVQITEEFQRILPVSDQAGRASRLVLFLSDTAAHDGEAGHLHYLASKAAAESAVRSLAKRLAPHTRVNAIAPGLIMFYPEDDEGYRARRLQQNLLPFEPGAHVICQTVDYLLACPAINATTIKVDNGHRP
jgi:dihydromonapterin reductase/dihydrofolate reductase